MTIMSKGQNEEMQNDSSHSPTKSSPTRFASDILESASKPDSQSKSIEVIADPVEIKERFIELVNSSSKEILLLFPSPRALRREEKIGVIDTIHKVAQDKRVNVRILTPPDLENSQGMMVGSNIAEKSDWSNNKVRSNGGSGIIQLRKIQMPRMESTVTIAVVDKEKSLVIEQKQDLADDFIHAIGLATYSRSRYTVLSNALLFETLWHESELVEERERALEKAERNKRQAELLQDILTHDIRNYNQVAKFSAELVKAELKDYYDQRIHSLLDSLLRSINGSTALVDRARKLGRFLSEGKAKLHSVNLIETVESSLALVRNAYPEKKVTECRTIVPSGMNVNQIEAGILADEFLREVFVNIYSNAIKYTQGSDVRIDTVIDSVEGEGRGRFWKISIIDHGKGVSNDMKERMYRRYLERASGSGLGMSIVHALVVQRYDGKLKIRDRVESDYTKGTVVEVLLPSA